ncbi:MAG: cupin [Acidimicrobiales bacterium]
MAPQSNEAGGSPVPVEGGVAVLPVGVATEDWTGEARFHEYSAAVDPLGSGSITGVPLRCFPAALHAAAGTRTVSLDLSDALGTAWAATGPSLLARFVCITAGDHVDITADATSTLVYCLRGRGGTDVEGQGTSGTVAWRAGDVITIPGCTLARHRADEDAVLYQVDDSPLLAYLGVRPSVPRFRPTRFDGEQARERLAQVAAEPGAAARNRVAVLLGNARNDQTLTATHTLWAMLGVLPEGQVQRPHRHQSIALDLIVDCRPGCFTLVGADIGPDGAIVDPERVDWEPGGAFVTPPGLWHSHHNGSGAPAHLLPVQDAGLHTYLRTLDIRFAT